MTTDEVREEIRLQLKERAIAISNKRKYGPIPAFILRTNISGFFQPGRGNLRYNLEARIQHWRDCQPPAQSRPLQLTVIDCSDNEARP